MDCVAFLRIGDHSGGRRKIGLYIAFEVQREFRVGDEVGEPVPWAGLPGDDDPPVNVVEPDLNTSRSATRGLRPSRRCANIGTVEPVS